MVANVWFFNHYAQVPGGPGSTRHHSLCRHLAASGWSGSLVAASTELNSGRQRLRPEEACRLETVDDVNVLWLRAPEYEGHGGGRMNNMASFAWRLLRTDLAVHLPAPDVVVGSTVHPLAAWAALRVAHRHGVPFVFEIRDLWPETLIAMGRLRSGHPVARLMALLERHLATRASRVVSVLPGIADYLARYGIPAERTCWIPNGADLDHYPGIGEATPSDRFRLVYLGAHGNANALDTLIEAMARLPAGTADRVQLQLVGDGPLKPALQEQAARRGLGNVEFLPARPKSELGRFATEADAFVLSAIDVPGLYRYGVSMNKLYDYMAMGRPVITALAAMNNPVTEARAGVEVPPRDPDALAAAIVCMASMTPDERAAMGNRGRAHLENHYDYRLLARRYAELLDAVVDEARTA